MDYLSGSPSERFTLFLLPAENQKSAAYNRYYDAQNKNKPVITGRAGFQRGPLGLCGVVMHRNDASLRILADITCGESRCRMGTARKFEVALIAATGHRVAEDDMREEIIVTP